jgi:hypothetical protein
MTGFMRSEMTGIREPRISCCSSFDNGMNLGNPVPCCDERRFDTTGDIAGDTRPR